MRNSRPLRKKSLTPFFLLTFVLSLPIYVLVGLASKDVILSSEMAFVFVLLAPLVPICAASLLTFRENGRDGTKKLLGRAFDHNRVARKIWYFPTVFLLPFLFTLALGVTVLLGQSLTPALFPSVALPIVFVLFFLMALGEEIGWMGYAIEPMQDQWNASKAALILGLIWALWHVPIYLFLIADPALIAAQAFSLVAIRILLVWLFDNTGNSVFVAILFHAGYNVTISVLPVNLAISCLVLLIAAATVTFLWSPATLAEPRWKDSENTG